jgi:23S rRNA (adenine2503-C2)-methyltransferase
LHSANDAARNALIPMNKRYPLDDLMQACAEYLAVKGRRISFEWALIEGVNDRTQDADELAALCRRFKLAAPVNLIPLEFRQLLEDRGVNATVRRNRGTDIDAACGQLAAGQPVVVGRKRR